MKTTIDIQTLLGFFSATGLPPLFKAMIGFVHPSIFTLACKAEWTPTAVSCYTDEAIEAWLYLLLTALAVAYGVWTLWQHLKSTTPPNGSVSALIPAGSIPVVTDAPGTGEPSVAFTSPQTELKITPATQRPPSQK